MIPVILAACIGLALGATLILAIHRVRRNADYTNDSDPLTGAMPFAQFKAEAPKLLAGVGNQYALWYCDIKNFKYINDACGYEAGDLVLKRAYELLCEEMGAGEMVCRVAADNFACLVHYQTREKMTARFSAVAARLGECRRSLAVKLEIQLYGGFYPVDAGETNLSLEEMLDRANIAQKSIKQQGEPRCAFYSERMRARLLEEQELESVMAEALQNGEFTIYLQPIIDLSQGGLYSAEALVRWIRPDGTRLAPDSFIPLFEKNGFIVEVDAFVFEQVCRLQRQRLDEGKVTVPINVNLSKNSMFRVDFAERYCAIRDKYRVPPGLLVLESTESVEAESMDWYRNVLHLLRNEGFLLALDDYGSGYASPALLKDFRWDVVKLDCLFFRPGDNQQQDENLIRGLVRMCRSVGVDVVAEGIEEQSQISFLQEIGCTAIQGYVFSRPVSLAEFDGVASRLSAETATRGGAAFLPSANQRDDRQVLLQVMRNFWYHYWNIQTADGGQRCALGEEMVFVGTALRDQVFGGRKLADWLQTRAELGVSAVPFRLSDEWYRTQPLSVRSWVVYGGFSVAAQRTEDQELAADTHMRFTAILSWEGEELTLQHLHASVPDRLQQEGMYHPLAESERTNILLREQLAQAELGREKALRARILVDEICHRLCACTGTQFLLADMANQRLEYDGDALRERFSLTPELLPGDASTDPQQQVLPLVHPDDRLQCLSAWAEAKDDQPFSLSLRLRNKVGAYTPLLVQVCPLEDSGLLLAVMRDQDSIRHLQAEDAQHPGIDKETGIWNRSGGRAAVDSYLAQPGGSGLLLMFVLVGEKLPITRFATLMKEFFRGDDILIRLEENRFAAFLKRARPDEAGSQKADTLCQRFNQEVEGAGVSCTVSESFAPENSTGFDTLYDRATRGRGRTPLASVPTGRWNAATVSAAPAGVSAAATAGAVPQSAPIFGVPSPQPSPTPEPPGGQTAPLFGTPGAQPAPRFGAPSPQPTAPPPPEMPPEPVTPEPQSEPSPLSKLF